MADTDRARNPAVLPPPKKKGLPFKRAAAKPVVDVDPFADESGPSLPDKSGDDDGLSLFRRSDKVFALALEEQGRRARASAEHKRRSSTTEEKDARGEDRKRPRTSSDHHADDDPFHSDNDDGAERESPPSRHLNGHRPGKRKSAEAYAPTGARGQAPTSEVIEISRSRPARREITPSLPPSAREDERRSESAPVIIDDDDFNDDDGRDRRKVREDSDSDVEVVENPNDEVDEYEHYITKARERQAARAAAAAAAENPGIQLNNSSNRGADSASDLPRLPPEHPTVSPNDPKIRIMITSSIPGAVPILVERRITQDMKVVRDTWINKERIAGIDLSKEELEGVFMTWKGNKIYNTTTGESLGVRLDADGRIMGPPSSRSRYSSGSSFDVDEGFQDNGLHFEMWTEALYQEHLRAKERDRLRSLGEAEYDNDDPGGLAEGEDLEEEPTTESHGQKFHLVLKAKDEEPAKLVAFAKTTMHILGAAFRAMRNIPEDRQITLRFDGDVLEPELTVGDTEIEDMDTIEVYIK